MRRVRTWWAQAAPKRFIQDASALGTAKAFGAAVNFVQGVLVARWLGPEQFGVAALTMSVPAVIFSFFDARSNAATVKFVSEFSGRKDAAGVLAMCRLSYSLDGAIALVTFFMVLATAAWAESHIVHRTGVASLMVLYAAAFLPRSLATTSRAMLTILGCFSLVAWIEIGTSVLGTVVVLGLVARGGGVGGFILGNAIMMAASGLGFAWLAFPRIRDRWQASWFSARWSALRGRGRTISRFLLYTELTELVNLFSKQADLVILGYFTGPTEAGYYGLAKKLTNAVDVLVQPLQSVLYPRLAKHWGAGRLTAFRELVQRYAQWVGLPLAGLVMVGLPLLPPALNLVVGASYRPAAATAQVLFATSALWLAFSWLRPAFHAMGAVKFVWLNASIVNVLNVCGFLIAAPRWGGVGMAWVSLLASGILNYLAGLSYYLATARRLPTPVSPAHPALTTSEAAAAVGEP